MSDPFTKNVFPRIKIPESNNIFLLIFVQVQNTKKILVVVEKVSFCAYLNGLFYTNAHYTFPALPPIYTTIQYQMISIFIQLVVRYLQALTASSNHARTVMIMYTCVWFRH